MFEYSHFIFICDLYIEKSEVIFHLCGCLSSCLLLTLNTFNLLFFSRSYTLYQWLDLTLITMGWTQLIIQMANLTTARPVTNWTWINRQDALVAGCTGVLFPDYFHTYSSSAFHSMIKFWPHKINSGKVVLIWSAVLHFLPSLILSLAGAGDFLYTAAMCTPHTDWRLCWCACATAQLSLTDRDHTIR